MNKLKIEKLYYTYKTSFNKKLDKKKLNEYTLKDISLELNDGLTVVLGPNGAGKSTLIKILTTLLKNKHGDIKFNDINYRESLLEIRKHLGYLPQDFSTYDNITGKDFLDIIARIKEVHKFANRDEEINKVVKELEMEDYINNKTKTYSGGMRQKLGIAQLLLGNPKLMVLDEPTVGLDPEQRNIIREIFPSLCKERIVIVTTHIVEDVEFYCKSLIVMKKGQVIYSGDKNEFIESYKGLIWESSISQEEYFDIKREVYVLSKKEDGNNIIIKYIADTPIKENSIEVEPTLEDAYIAAQQDYYDIL